MLKFNSFKDLDQSLKPTTLPKKYLVNFASRGFYQSQRRLNLSAARVSFDGVYSYNENVLKQTSFYQENQLVFKEKKGYGYWIWKPYILLEAMKKIKPGDVLFYLDAGIEIVGDVSSLVSLCISKNGILLFGVDRKLNRAWTKRDCFILMNGDSKEFWDSIQASGGTQIYIKNDSSIRFLNEWFHYCLQPGVINDSSNVMGQPNFQEFIEHRHDQSILSILAVKYGLELFRDPSQWGDPFKREDGRCPQDFLPRSVYEEAPFLNSSYPTIFNSHRARDLSWMVRIKRYLKRIVQLN